MSLTPTHSLALGVVANTVGVVLIWLAYRRKVPAWLGALGFLLTCLAAYLWWLRHFS
jgi:hypothetical protein